MIYTYKCSHCKSKKDLDIPMGEDLPKTILCEKCKTETMKHDFMSQINSQAITVPYWFKATNDTGVKYKKDGTSDLMR